MTRYQRSVGDEHVLDAALLGRMLKGARIAAGFQSVHELSELLERDHGVKISGGALGKYEQGRVIPSLEMFLLLMAVLQPIGGYQQILIKASRQDIRDQVLGAP